MSAGFDPARFWDITLREAEREFRGLAKVRERETNERLWLAWHTVALDRTERLPKLETLLIKAEPKRQQSGEEMLLAMKSIFFAFGGDPAELENTNEPSSDR